MTAFKTRSEQRLEQLEAIRRPLTKREGDDLRRCLHAIYMRNWRLERSISNHGGGGLLEVQKQARVETNAIAYRMENATDEAWEQTHRRFDQWQDDARNGSEMLLTAILKAQDRAVAA
jgi:hypothetical protein